MGENVGQRLVLTTGFNKVQLQVNAMRNKVRRTRIGSAVGTAFTDEPPSKKDPRKEVSRCLQNFRTIGVVDPGAKLSGTRACVHTQTLTGCL